MEFLNKNNRYIIIEIQLYTNSLFIFSISELAAVELINGKLTSEFYSAIFSDETKECINNNKQNWGNFIEFIGNSKIFIHNSNYKIDIINSHLINYGFNCIRKDQVLCSGKIFNELFFPEIPEDDIFPIDFCCNYLKLVQREKKFNSAIDQCFLCGFLVSYFFEYKQYQNNIGINLFNNNNKRAD